MKTAVSLSRLSLVALLVAWQAACGFSAEKRAKNVILFIGDGMGPAQVAAAAYEKLGQTRDAQGNPPKLSFEQFPSFGYLTTFSANSLVTDSSAAATAYACGQKTDNGMLGVTPDKTRLKNIATIAHEKGKAVGIISSVAFNHATPAAFFAYDDSRNDYDEITNQVFANPAPDVVMGGGIIYGKTAEVKTGGKQVLKGNERWSMPNLEAQAQKSGTKIFTCDNFDQLSVQNVGQSRVLGIFDLNKNNQLDFESSRTADTREPHLSQMTAKTLDLLERNTNGFFLMVESGSIDWACHGNKAPEVFGEISELDKTVAQTVEYLRGKGQLDDTLIMVTADHETGGFSIPGPYKKTLKPGQEPKIKFTSNEHTAMPVAVWSQGPGSEALRGKNDNTFVFRLMDAQFE